MKIAFCVISNRPEKLLRMAMTIEHAMVKGPNYSLCISYTDPIYADLIKAIRNRAPRRLNIISKRRKEQPGIFNYAKARMHSFGLIEEDTDFLIMIDDDFMFTAGTENSRYSSGDRYMDGVRYLKTHRDCGIILNKGFLGGSPYGRTIVAMDKGYFDTGLGLIVRGKDRAYENIIDRELWLPGAGEDVAVCFTAMAAGNYCAKAFNNPTRKDQTKKLSVKKGKPTKNLVKKGAYHIDNIYKNGIFANIVERFGEFEHGNTIPATWRQMIKAYKGNPR